MKTKDLILIDQFCELHNIDVTFISSLQEFGLIEIVIIEDSKYLSHEQLNDVEKMMRLHYELDINMEGIDAISNLLQRIDLLQQELLVTKNRLRLFDHD